MNQVIHIGLKKKKPTYQGVISTNALSTFKNSNVFLNECSCSFKICELGSIAKNCPFYNHDYH